MTSFENSSPTGPRSVSLWLVGAAGMITALAFPSQPIPYADPVSFWPLIFVSVSPFFARLLVSTSLHETMQTAFAFSLPWLLIAGVWVFRVFDALGWILIWIPIVWVIVFALAAKTVQRCGFSVVWAWPVLWMGVEVIRSEWSPLRFDWLSHELDPLNFTWFGLGHPRLFWPPAAQSADVIGGVGLAITPLLTNLFIALVWSRYAVNLRWFALCTIAVGIIDAGYCAWRWQQPTEGPTASVGVVQSERYEISVLVELTDALMGAAPKTALVVWPELAFAVKPGDQQKLEEYARRRGITLVTGVEIATADGYRNRAWWIRKDGPTEEYAKQMRVPFVERHPASQICTTFPLAVGSRTSQVGVLICYDIDFSWPARRLVNECGAEMIVMPTLDDITWGGTQHVQHSLLPRLRAIENRRPIVQAATSGVSQILDHRGHVLASIPFRLTARPDRSVPYLEGFAHGLVAPQSAMSFYTKTGHFLATGLAALAGLLTAVAIGWQGLASFRRKWN